MPYTLFIEDSGRCFGPGCRSTIPCLVCHFGRFQERSSARAIVILLVLVFSSTPHDLFAAELAGFDTMDAQWNGYAVGGPTGVHGRGAGILSSASFGGVESCCAEAKT